VPAFFNHLLKTALDFVKWRGERAPAGVDDDIPVWAEFGAMLSKCLANAALDTVSRHCFSQGFRDREPDADAGGVLAGPAEGRKQWAGNTEAVVIDDAKVGGFLNLRRSR
jgi:hypothetical protein